MIIGLVGLPSSGKSSFFKASTLAEVDIANYPFTTIKPNEGIAYVKVDCVDKDFKTQCNPRQGYCINHNRFVPFKIIDVAGLIEGAHKGEGMGNQFLSDLNEANALIHVIDISGSTNDRGEAVEPLSHNPLKNVEILENELDQWYLQLFTKNWDKFVKLTKQTKQKTPLAISKQLSGLRVTEDLVKESIAKLKLKEDLAEWTSSDIYNLAHELRIRSKPMIIAANKIDIEGAEKYFKELKEKYPEHIIIASSAQAEIALREAHKKELIQYIPGENNFKIINEQKLNSNQKQALEYIKTQVLDKFNSTGVQDILNQGVFNLLKYMAIFPGGMNKLEDKDGNRLPDCFLMKSGSTALDFAYRIHQDIGNNFIKAFDVKTRMVIGRDHKLKNRDVIEIATRK